MGTSVFIAKVFGPAYLILAVGMLANRDILRKVMEDFGKNAALVFFIGLFTLFLGMVIVLLHNVWVADWRVLITIFGWGGLIKGIWLTVFPNPRVYPPLFSLRNCEIGL